MNMELMEWNGIPMVNPHLWSQWNEMVYQWYIYSNVGWVMVYAYSKEGANGTNKLVDTIYIYTYPLVN